MSGGRVLVIDDDEAQVEAVGESLRRADFVVESATSGEEGLHLAEQDDFDVVLTDLVMQGTDGLEVLRRVREMGKATQVVVVTAHGSVQSAVRAMESGAVNYLQKPLDLGELRTVVHKAVERAGLVRQNSELRRQLDKRFGFEGILGHSPAMQRIFDILAQVAPTNATVLLEGESGTGKELLARAIHQQSPRRGQHFVALNCAALSEGILESELFGHERGSFTGAIATKVGRIEYAHRGTLLLDEVADMPASTQVKLLRVLEEREIYRVGSNVPIRVDVRVLAATNKSLEGEVESGRFREDLYFRLKVVTIALPPLRERLEDLPLLANAFLQELASQHGKTVESLDADTIAAFHRYRWPGNVRELRNTIETMVVMARCPRLTREDLPPHLRGLDAPQGGGAPLPAAGAPGGLEPAGASPAADPFRALAGAKLDDVERELIRATLEKTGGRREAAAKLLGIGARTLYRKIKEYDLR